ncbi:MAG: tRNA (adenosine(37)-N6)-threonylcarbamoyltransferase complex ATPase subunit type 1 TsaE [Clostridiales bacterium]|jgi:tRNA A37 threonylcarbamoyladenosine biosynthesis protein TsaE|nr:tRNA (adenosine(37)-N6)-threonylcarbamoyltransferase complex ATPase subunit type 1 TsaE [Clostridiales bacterium]
MASKKPEGRLSSPSADAQAFGLPAQFASASPDDTRAVGFRLGKALRHGETVMLHGDIGAGKTVFVSGIAHALGVREPVTSPTYTFSNTSIGAVWQGGADCANCASDAASTDCAGCTDDAAHTGANGGSGKASGAGSNDGSGDICGGIGDGGSGDSCGASPKGGSGDTSRAGGRGSVSARGRGAAMSLCHFDAYRIGDPDDAVEIGLADSIGDAGGVTVVEWAENIQPYYPDAYYDVCIAKTAEWNDDRLIRIEHFERSPPLLVEVMRAESAGIQAAHGRA